MNPAKGPSDKGSPGGNRKGGWWPNCGNERGINARGRRADSRRNFYLVIVAVNLWHHDHPDQRFVSQVRLSDFAKERSLGVENQQSADTFLSILGIDPLARLDPASREVQKSPETLHVIVHLLKLIVIGRVGDGSEMENGVEAFAAELGRPIERG